MSDCPLCDWRYDPTAACIASRQVGQPFPVVWDGDRLRSAWGSEGINSKHVAAGHHVCTEHPMDAAVLLLGPVEDYKPLAEFNRFVTEQLATRRFQFGWF